jgi:NADH-quinone oxidoreductase subunit K
MNGSYDPYLYLGAVLFVLGAVGFVTRRNLILMMLSAELMLHGVSLTLLAFGEMHGGMDGQAFTVFVLTVAACEAGLSLAIILTLFQRSQSLDVELWSALKEPGVEAGVSEDDVAQLRTVPREMRFPQLTAAGGLPSIDEDAPLEPQTVPASKRKKARSFRYGKKPPREEQP